MNFMANTWHLEDFNQDGDPADSAPASTTEPDLEPAEPILENAWTDGYMHAARHLAVASDHHCPNPDMLTALGQMEDRLSQSVETASLLVARLLLDATTALGREHWSAGVEERIQRMTDLVKPALLSTVPQISVRSQDGKPLLVATAPGTHAVADETIQLVDSITLSWRLGKAEASWTETLREMVSALAPLLLDAIDAEPEPLTADRN